MSKDYGEPFVFEWGDDDDDYSVSSQHVSDLFCTSSWRNRMSPELWQRVVACVNALAGMNPEALGEFVEAVEVFMQAAGTVDILPCEMRAFDVAGDRVDRALAKLRGEDG